MVNYRGRRRVHRILRNARVRSNGNIGDVANQKSVKRGPEDEILNDDERVFLYWQSRYTDPLAQRLIQRETVYVVALIFVSLFLLLITWHGAVPVYIADGCIDCSAASLRKYSYLYLAGMLGGALFGLKYLYKVVARGYWNQDRAIWRYTSPVLSGGLAFAAGALTDAGIFGFATSYTSGGASFVALGFIVGYFADSASRKMQEVAETLFGHPAAKASGKSAK